MSHVLTKFGFEGYIKSAIMALYSCPSAQVYTSGLLSKTFPISNGTRQGCPLSPGIFNLMIEPLAEIIRQDPAINGLQVGEEKHVVSLFADDVILFLTDPKTSLPQTLQILQSFSSVSYYKVNFSKSLILDLGVEHSTKKYLQDSLPFSWASDSIPYLGITLTQRVQSIPRKNYETLYNTIQTQLKAWSTKDLSWAGRLAALKMSILPQIIYYFRVLPMHIPNRTIKPLTQALAQFLWLHKKPRCAHRFLIAHKSVGGLGLPDLNDYRMAAILDQIRHWFSSSDHPKWVHLEQSLSNSTDLKSLLLMDMVKPYTLQQFPTTVKALY